jgi:acyl-CoA thioesterase-2
MSDAIATVVSLLDLEELEVNLFRGHSPQEDRQRVFGGQVLGQALTAAGRTVEEGREAHSLHAYFLRPGDLSIPILYQVDPTRHGRTFTTRRVTAIQRGRAIFQLEASFQRAEPGPEHQHEMPTVPDPETLPTWREYMQPLLEKSPLAKRWKGSEEWVSQDRPIDIRHLTPFNPFEPQTLPPKLMVWIRAAGALPGELLQHQCVVAYASDMTLLDTALLPHGAVWGGDQFQVASLDHAMWFHREFRADEWLLYTHESPVAAGARGFSTGKIFTRDGRLVVSVVQEGLMRPMSRDPIPGSGGTQNSG